MPGPIGINNVVQDGPFQSLSRRLSDLERLVREMSAAKTLENATVGQGGIRTANFDGSSFADPGATGNYFGADGAVLNNLYLRNGIVGDAALANPVAFNVASHDWDTLTFTIANLEKTVAITVPSGYTRALVTATATAGATASASAVANTYVSCSIQGVHPEFIAEQMAANFAGSATRSYAASLTGLTVGGSVTVGALGVIDTNGSVVAGSCNLHVTATAIFLR